MKAILFDTETTGLIRNRSIPLEKQPEVVEFYASVWDLKKGKRLKEINFLFKPSRPMDQEVIRIHGITNEMVADAPAFAARAGVIKSFIEKEAPVIIAHNIKFDVDMMDLEYRRLGQMLKWPRKICTVEQTQHIKGFRMNLSALHEHLTGEKFEGAHRAKVDVEALARCACKLFAMEMV